MRYTELYSFKTKNKLLCSVLSKVTLKQSVLGQKGHHNKFQETEMVQTILLAHNAIKLNINKQNREKFTYGNFKHFLLNSSYIKEEFATKAYF